MRLFSSLTYRIAATIFVLEAVMMVVVLGLTLERIEGNTKRQTAETERVIFDLFAGLSRTALFTVEYGELQQYVEQVAKDPNVRRVLIANRHGRVVASNQFADVGQGLPADFTDDADHYWRRKQIDRMGEIAIQFSLLPLQQTRREALKVGVFTALAGMVFIALSGIGFGYLLTRRLSDLGDAARQISRGEYDLKIDVDGQDEVAVLARTLSQMAGQIRANVSELERKQVELVAARDELEIRVHERTIELEMANDKLKELSEIDPLTRIANRRRFDETLNREVRRAHRNGLPLSLIMLDVDFFKRYNDHYGHTVGDHCLVAVAGAICHAASRRPGDLTARYGGEEFVVVLPETPREGAEKVARQILAEVDALGIPHARSDAMAHVTVSLGVTTYDQTAVESSALALIQTADAALYQAKEQGRHGFVAASA